MENTKRIEKAITDALRDAQALTNCLRRSGQWNRGQADTGCDNPDILSTTQLLRLEQFGDTLALCDDRRHA